ncbi:RNase RNM [Agarivorans sp. MS3-6]|uniref:RNase RNM n=1 Tax=Agarivorans sp. TSD2052 TaxID=2937286 RepID=UPI002010BECB|nr:PHP domain-containing protein [Agarivorans sp. TSD2052]UPW17113.1 PHP domain-containing protein [Agarivorans sp. TSD2052]
MRFDLHCHTTASDGGLSPKEIVMRAENMQVDVLAITDHDTTAGVAEAQANAKHLQIIAGTEISTAWHAFDIHVVGLNLDTSHQGLQDNLLQQRDKREIRALEMSRRLDKVGIVDVYTQAKQLAGSAPLTRSHFAKVLIERGVAANFNKVFDKYLSRGNTGYVPNNWMSIGEAVAVIQQAGGVAVLAHPTHYELSNKWVRKLIAEFAEAGGDGIEIAMPQISKDQLSWLADLAEQHQLSASQGSDFHHPSPWRELGRGLHLPEKCQPIWQRWQSQ